jgi:nicotinate-nucleotide--dimethylbenzimidazole phosphoribosyltransferase
VSEQQEHPESAVAAQEPTQPTGEPEAPVGPATPPVQEPETAEQPAEAAPADAPAPAEAETPPAPEAETPPAPEAETPPADASAPAEAETPPAPEADTPAAAEGRSTVGPKILGVAEEKTLPVVKKRLQEKPKREPLPWPELRAAVAATREELDVAELKELFRLFPEKLRDEVVENVRGFKKGARRPVSQHAAKQLARASHTARRMKKNSHPSGEVAQALGQAMAAELIASLEPEKAAQIILPKRDLLEREARQAHRRARDEEDRARDEQRRRRRDDARSSRQQTSFGEFSGAKIQGLDEVAALFRSDEPAPAAPAPDPTPAPETAPAAEAEAPVTPATTSLPDESPAQVEPEAAPEAPAEQSDAPGPDTDEQA